MRQSLSNLPRSLERAKNIAVVGCFTSLIGMTLNWEWLREGSMALLAGAPLGIVATKAVAGAGEKLGLSPEKSLFIGAIVAGAAGVGVAAELHNYDVLDSHQAYGWEIGTVYGVYDGVMLRAQELDDRERAQTSPYYHQGADQY